MDRPRATSRQLSRSISVATTQRLPATTIQTPTPQPQPRSSTRDLTPTSISHASARSFHSETSSTNSGAESNHLKLASPFSRTNTRRSKNSGATSSKLASANCKEGQHFVVAIVEGRGTGAEVGMCFCDIKTSEVILCQIADSQTYVRTLQKLNLYEPSEILVPAATADPVNSKLVNIIKETMPTSTIISTARRSFNDTTDPRLGEFTEWVDEVIEKNVVLEKTAVGIRHQRCFAVKAGRNGLLDVARQTYKETCNDILDLTNRYVQELGISLKVQFNVTMGYYFTTTIDQLGGNEIPLVFINIVKKNKTLTFTTLELIKKNAKINDSLIEVYLMSDKIVNDLSSKIRGEIGALYKVSEAVAMLDMLLSFTHQCTVNDFIRPEFTDTLVIKRGHHPVLEKINLLATVPNDTYAGSANSFQIITGPNMSGKSTYLRQVALLTIMAHIASFIPAEYASFRVIHQLMSRICNDDCVELNASNFMTEMKETAYIVENATEKSLVIIDELGRGTSTYDGLGIAFAVCEELIHSRALVFFATHFQELAATLTNYHNVVNLHLETEMTRDKEQPPGLLHTYRLTEGPAKEEHYGLVLAKSLNLMQKAWVRAEEVSIRLTNLQESARRHSESNRIVARRRALAQVAHESNLVWKAAKDMTGHEIALALRDIQKTVMSRLLAIKEQQDRVEHDGKNKTST
ncbi:MutS protein msh4 [Linnemannia zychae]|nr:MutS protein msh4 [Linnemannia zychae]